MASIQKKTVKGIDYWYLIESKRVNGKVTTEIIEYFGNTKKLVERFGNMLNRKNNIQLKSYSHGDTHALFRIANKLDIINLLDKTFHSQVRDGVKRGMSLVLIAIQRVCKPGSKNAFSDWFKTTTLHDELNIKPDVLSCNHFWDQMDNINEQQLQKAEDEITKRIFELYDLKLDKIALDYTNYFTYIDSTNDKSDLAKRGRNKQKRNDLKQFSLAVITSKELGIPLYSHVYEGNLNDQTEFAQYIELLKARIPDYDKKDLTFVFDGGSVNKSNLESIDNYYICRFSLTSCKQLYDIDTSDYNTIKIDGKDILYKRLTEEIWDKKRTCILTYSQKLYNGMVAEMSKDIEKAKELLNELNAKLKNPRSRLDKRAANIKNCVSTILKRAYMEDICEIEFIGVRVIKELRYEFNNEKKDAIQHKYFGKKLIITNRDHWSTEEILRLYRDQDCIEKIFRDSKNNSHFSIRPQYHFTDQKIRVHIFCCLLGIILIGIMNMELRRRGIVISNEKLIDTLHGIRQSWIKEPDSNKVAKVLEDMDDFTNNIWNEIMRI